MLLVLAQVERATHERLDNVRGPDQFTVVLDARDASTLQVTRKVTLFKDTAVALNQVRSYVSLACSMQQVSRLLPIRQWRRCTEGKERPCTKGEEFAKRCVACLSQTSIKRHM